MLLKTRIIISCCFISLLAFFEEDCYASRPGSKECVKVSSASFTVRGRVIDTYGEPLIGATIREKGGANGTVTDVEGNFFLSVPDSAVLQISFVGYESQEVSVKGRSMLEICLKENILLLDHVIVTALGLEKKESSLAYAVQKVRGEELNRVKEVNMITALAGKAAGVQVSKNSSGMGGSAKVSIRGVRSVAGDNQPLYVIDGVPMLNSTSEQAYSAIGGTANAGNRDGGDGISNLNPEDVESISILKGAPAAALYGSQAANGVILITTKKGNTVGRRDIHFSTGLTFEKAFSLPEMQNSYGVSDVTDSWGEKENLTVYDNLGDFFRTGLTSITSVSVNSGNDKLQTYFSYANTTGRGILNENKLSKHNINLRETAVLFNSRLKLDGNVNVMKQTVKNKPVSGGFYMNPLVGLYRFPRGEDLSYYKENYERYDEDRKLNTQNWHTFTEDFEQNPYWIQNRIQSKDARIRLLLSLSANLKVTDWLTLQARGNLDYSADKLRQKFYASTATALCGMNGRYIEMDYQETQMYGDVMAMVKKQLNDFTLDVAIGGSINDRITNSTRIDSKNASLKYANVFNLANIVMSSSASIDQKIDAHYQLQSLFATAQIGYKEGVFLDLTARNDWSSTLPKSNRSFFYPSVSVSAVMNELFLMPEPINLLKVRGSFAQVGNDTDPYKTSPYYGTSDFPGSAIVSSTLYNQDFKPEISTNYETGFDFRMFHNRIGLDFTFYYNRTKNQILDAPMDPTTGYSKATINSGCVRNRGYEIQLDVTPVVSRDFRWNATFTWSKNENRILSLAEGADENQLISSIGSVSIIGRVGGTTGDLWGYKLVRDPEGNVVINDNGLPERSGEIEYVGTAYPKWKAGLYNEFSYKNFTLSVLLDGQVGGKMYSHSHHKMTEQGKLQHTLNGRLPGTEFYMSKDDPRIAAAGLSPQDGMYMIAPGTVKNDDGTYSPNTKVVTVESYYKEYYRMANVETNTFDTSFLKLREMRLEYKLPNSTLKKTPFSKASVALYARNLFCITDYPLFDPESAALNGSSMVTGVETGSLPTARTFGLNINVSF